MYVHLILLNYLPSLHKNLNASGALTFMLRNQYYLYTECKYFREVTGELYLQNLERLLYTREEKIKRNNY